MYSAQKKKKRNFTPQELWIKFLLDELDSSFFYNLGKKRKNFLCIFRSVKLICSTAVLVYNLRGGWVGFRCTQTGTKRFSHTKYIYIPLLTSWFFQKKFHVLHALYKDMELGLKILIWVFWDQTKMFWPRNNLFQGGGCN